MTNSISPSFMKSTGVWGAVLALVTFAVYTQVAGHEFINFDDEEYVTAEPLVQEGLTWEGFRWAATDVSASNWFPLTRLSHMLDCELFGVRPGPHLLVNVLIHIANTLLLLWLLVRMTGVLGPAVFAAAVFALHPLHVESVAWVSERKDLLSTFFALVTLNVHLAYIASRRVGIYAVALVAYACALMSKSMVVTLPCVMLLLDLWPLKRFGSLSASKLVLEKIPYFLLAGLVSIITVVAQGQGGAIESTTELSLSVRLANAVTAYGAYLGKMFLPTGLGIFYPYPDAPPSTPHLLIVALVLVLISLAAIVLIRRCPYVFTGWFWFAGMMVPVIGIVQVGNQAMADRYTYLSMTGIAVIVAWGAVDLAAKFRVSGRLLAVSGLTVSLVLAGLTAWQLTHWRTSETLFRHTIAVTGGSSKAHNNLGTALFDQARYGEAELEFRKALEFGPGNIQARNNLGAALLLLDQPAEALALFEQVLSANPDDAKAELNAAVALLKLGRREEAIERARRALSTGSGYAPAAAFLAEHGEGPP